MTNRRQVELEIELKVRFKGDQETGQNLQNGLENALGGLVASQGRALGLSGPKRVIEVPPTSVRRRRGARSQGTNKSETRNTEESGLGTSGPNDHVRRPNGSGCSRVTKELVDAGFFGQKRSIADVVAELSNKGFVFKSNHVSSVCKQLTVKKSLERRGADNRFLYRSAGR
jgi:hypothetical protein